MVLFALPVSGRDPASNKPTFVFIHTFPFYYLDENGQQTGFNYEIAKFVFDALEIEADFFGMPVGRTFREVNEGTQDFTTSYRMPDLFEGIQYFASFGCQQIVLMPLKNSGIKSFKDLVGKRISYAQGGRFDKTYSRRKDFVRVPAINTETMFRLVQRGRTDGVVMNTMAFESLRIASPPNQNLQSDIWTKFGDPVFIMPIEVAFGVSKKSKYRHLVPLIENFVSEGLEKDIFAPIFKKYGEATGGVCSAMITDHTKLPDE